MLCLLSYITSPIWLHPLLILILLLSSFLCRYIIIRLSLQTLKSVALYLEISIRYNDAISLLRIEYWTWNQEIRQLDLEYHSIVLVEEKSAIN